MVTLTMTNNEQQQPSSSLLAARLLSVYPCDDNNSHHCGIFHKAPHLVTTANFILCTRHLSGTTQTWNSAITNAGNVPGHQESKPVGGGLSAACCGGVGGYLTWFLGCCCCVWLALKKAGWLLKLTEVLKGIPLAGIIKFSKLKSYLTDFLKLIFWE